MGNVPISCCRSKSPRNDRNYHDQQNNFHHRHSSSSNNNRGPLFNQKNGSNIQYSSNNASSKFSDRLSSRHNEDSYEQSYILQHISEREPDDSETDPSSNPYNRPIFATRTKHNNHINNHIHLNSQNPQNDFDHNYKINSFSNQSDNYLNNNDNHHNSSLIKKLIISPISSSGTQDTGYQSASNNLNSNNTTTSKHETISTDSFDKELTSINKKNHHKNKNKQQKQSIKSEFQKGDSSAVSSSSKTSKQSSVILRNSTSINRLPTTRQFDSSGHLYCDPNLIKASSCSTIYIDDSTISQPDLQLTIKCVSLAVYYHIRSRSSDSCADIFDESVHPLKMPINPPTLSKSSRTTIDELMAGDIEHDDDEDLGKESEDNEDDDQDSQVSEAPDKRTIYNFVKTLFKAAQLTSEYAITTLVYLERLMTYAEMDLSPKTWRRMFLGAILLSSKVWEDQAVWNVDYAQILEDITVEDINELERQFLELIQFNMNVPSSVYAKYYFHLRTLAFKNGLIRQQGLMTVGKAKTLEAMSRVNKIDWHSSPIHRKEASPKLEHYASLEKSRLKGAAKAVLM